MQIPAVTIPRGFTAKGKGTNMDTITKETAAERLEYLRGELQAERISYGELAELQSLKEFIDLDDVELLEAAGVPEELVNIRREALAKYGQLTGWDAISNTIEELDGEYTLYLESSECDLNDPEDPEWEDVQGDIARFEVKIGAARKAMSELQELQSEMIKALETALPFLQQRHKDTGNYPAWKAAEQISTVLEKAANRG